MAISKREFLISAAAAAGGLMLGRSHASAQRSAG